MGFVVFGEEGYGEAGGGGAAGSMVGSWLKIMIREGEKRENEKESGGQGGDFVLSCAREKKRRRIKARRVMAMEETLFSFSLFSFCYLPSNSMHVVLYREWKRHVQDELHLGDIQPSSCHVGCHE